MLAKHKIQHQRYDCMVAKIQKGGISLDYETDPLLRHKSSKLSANDDSSAQNQSDSIRRLAMSANALQKVGYIRCQ